MQKENLDKLLPNTGKVKNFTASKPGQKSNASATNASNRPKIKPRPNVTLTSKGEPTCHGWNDTSGGNCRNNPNAKTGGCIDTFNREFAHVCNAPVQGKPGGICEKRHRRVNH